MGDETFDEGCGIERGENAPEGVVAGRAVGELENAARPGFLEFGEALEVFPAGRKSSKILFTAGLLARYRACLNQTGV